MDGSASLRQLVVEVLNVAPVEGGRARLLASIGEYENVLWQLSWVAACASGLEKSLRDSSTKVEGDAVRFLGNLRRSLSGLSRSEATIMGMMERIVELERKLLLLEESKADRGRLDSVITNVIGHSAAIATLSPFIDAILRAKTDARRNYLRGLLAILRYEECPYKEGTPRAMAWRRGIDKIIANLEGALGGE